MLFTGKFGRCAGYATSFNLLPVSTPVVALTTFVKCIIITLITTLIRIATTSCIQFIFLPSMSEKFLCFLFVATKLQYVTGWATTQCSRGLQRDAPCFKRGYNAQKAPHKNAGRDL